MTTTFLKSFDDKEKAQDFRDKMRLKVLAFGMTPRVTVGIRFMHGVGGYAVELHHDDTDLLAAVLSSGARRKAAHQIARSES